MKLLKKLRVKVNRRINKYKKSLYKLLKRKWDEIDILYATLLAMMACGLILLVLGGMPYFENSKILQNFLFGSGTGMVSSSIVTIFVEIVNRKEKTKRNIKLRKIVFGPFIKSTKRLYEVLSIIVNEYRILKEKKDYLLLPISDFSSVKVFFDELMEIQVDSIENERLKKKYEDIVLLPLIHFQDLILQYERMPFENLLSEDVITKEEYDKMKNFRLITQVKTLISELNKIPVLEKDYKNKKINLLRYMMALLERLYENFDFIGKALENENEIIKSYLDEFYYFEIYCNSEEYISQMIESSQHYCESDSLAYEEIDEEKMLIDEITFAIMIFDKNSMIELFKKIDHNNAEIKSIFNSKESKKFMRDKDMKRLYYEKYGEQYKNSLF